MEINISSVRSRFILSVVALLLSLLVILWIKNSDYVIYNLHKHQLDDDYDIKVKFIQQDQIHLFGPFHIAASHSEITSDDKFQLRQSKVLFEISNYIIPFIKVPYIPTVDIHHSEKLENCQSYYNRNKQQQNRFQCLPLSDHVLDFQAPSLGFKYDSGNYIKYSTLNTKLEKIDTTLKLNFYPLNGETIIKGVKVCLRDKGIYPLGFGERAQLFGYHIDGTISISEEAHFQCRGDLFVAVNTTSKYSRHVDEKFPMWADQFRYVVNQGEHNGILINLANFSCNNTIHSERMNTYEGHLSFIKKQTYPYLVHTHEFFVTPSRHVFNTTGSIIQERDENDSSKYDTRVDMSFISTLFGGIIIGHQKNYTHEEWKDHSFQYSHLKNLFLSTDIMHISESNPDYDTNSIRVYESDDLKNLSDNPECLSNHQVELNYTNRFDKDILGIELRLKKSPRDSNEESYNTKKKYYKLRKRIDRVDEEVKVRKDGSKIVRRTYSGVPKSILQLTMHFIDEFKLDNIRQEELLDKLYEMSVARLEITERSRKRPFTDDVNDSRDWHDSEQEYDEVSFNSREAYSLISGLNNGEGNKYSISENKLRLVQGTYTAALNIEYWPLNKQLGEDFVISRNERLVHCDELPEEANQLRDSIECLPIESHIVNDTYPDFGRYYKPGKYVKMTTWIFDNNIRVECDLYPLVKHTQDRGIKECMRANNISRLNFAYKAPRTAFHVEGRFMIFADNVRSTFTGQFYMAFNQTIEQTHKPVWPSIPPDYYDALLNRVTDGFESGVLICSENFSLVPINKEFHSQTRSLDTDFTLIIRQQFPFWIYKHYTMSKPERLVFTFNATIQQNMDSTYPNYYNSRTDVKLLSSHFFDLIGIPKYDRLTNSTLDGKEGTDICMLYFVDKPLSIRSLGFWNQTYSTYLMNLYKDFFVVPFVNATYIDDDNKDYRQFTALVDKNWNQWRSGRVIGSAHDSKATKESEDFRKFTDHLQEGLQREMFGMN